MTTCTVYFALCINFLAYCIEIFAKFRLKYHVRAINRNEPVIDIIVVLMVDPAGILVCAEAELHARHYHHLFLRSRRNYDGTG